MEQIDYEVTEVDRCTIRNGIYVDAGEPRDLSAVAISDFFKGLAAAQRT